MGTEATAAGFVGKSAHGRLPRLQIVTVEDLFAGHGPVMPPLPEPQRGTARPRRKAPDTGQLPLFLPFEGSKTVQDKGAFVDPRFLRFGR